MIVSSSVFDYSSGSNFYELSFGNLFDFVFSLVYFCTKVEWEKPKKKKYRKEFSFLGWAGNMKIKGKDQE